ncbi:hypothetical protein I4U23_017463 [Adineta vaga]|nr:hypothetical protein I4U23_017463 [Adineta vaga]
MNPTIIVTFDKPAEVQSVTLPRDKTPNGNVEQFEVTFYSPDGKKINEKPIESSVSRNNDKSKPATVDSNKVPSTSDIGRVYITATFGSQGTTTLVTSGATSISANETTTTPSVPHRCQTEDSLDEELGLLNADSITETTKGETTVVGFVIRANGTGWTPSSAFSSLNIDYRHGVEIGRIRLNGVNLKEWRLYFQSASDIYPRWIAFDNGSVLTNNELILPTTLNATKIRISPNGEVKNLHVEVYACSSFVTETTTTDRTCSLSEWSEWTPCSRTCGIGYKTRSRNGSSSISCSNEQLLEHQSCINRRCECLLDEAFYIRVFKKEPTSDKEIGYIHTYVNGTTESQNIVYINDTVEQGTIIRTRDRCYIVYCTADGLKLSNNQCLVTTTTMQTTTPITNSTECTMQQYDNGPIKVNNGKCISRNSFPRERCGGYCESDSSDQCKCCGIGETESQAVLFDCFVDGSTTQTVEKVITIQRIKSCSCNVCHDKCSVHQFDSAPLRINKDQCISRENIPRERCSGQCESDSDDQCTCCSVGETYLQPVIFDCFVDGLQNEPVQKTVEIRRIRSCNCNVCSGSTSNSGK